MNNISSFGSSNNQADTDEAESDFSLSDTLGGSYNYANKINNPSSLGMSSNGSMGTLGKNITGLIGYIQALISGRGVALKNLGDSGVLGNKYFLNTLTKCKNEETNKLEDRYIFINHVPDGNIPFLSSGDSVGSMRGLLPGVLSNIAQVKPNELYDSMLEGNQPKCREIELEVIDTSGNCSKEKHFLAISEINNMPASWKVPECSGFTNYDEKTNNVLNTSHYSNDIYTKLYFLSINVLFFYILIKLMYQKK
tara:strand:+ start:716 stop:1471 length:756 start_codon:yes stop_codon:yes gene_type:complete